MESTDFAPLAGPYTLKPNRWINIATWAVYALAIAVVVWRVTSGVL